MARKQIEWLIAIGGLTYGRPEGIKVGDTMEVGKDISEEQAALRVAHGQAHFVGERKGRPGQANPAYLHVIQEHSAKVAASAQAAAEGPWSA